jgi:predicted RNA-binding Zn-ribbon protein involved in translation (DUF1610 family)
MRTCPSCYRQVEDLAHIICPDCGSHLPKPDQMSSEDASDYTAAHHHTPGNAPTKSEMLEYYEGKIAEIDSVHKDMKRLDGAFQLMGKLAGGNQFAIAQVNQIVEYQQRLIHLAIDYRQILSAFVMELDNG